MGKLVLGPCHYCHDPVNAYGYAHGEGGLYPVHGPGTALVSCHYECWQKRGLYEQRVGFMPIKRLDLEKINPRAVRPSGNRVLLYRENVAVLDGLAVPQQSAEAWRWTIIGVGPDVKNLSVHDVVYVGGTQMQQDFAKVPCCQDIYITVADNVLVIVGNPPPINSEKPDGCAYEKVAE